jgi:invasion protein IalB
VKLAVLVLSQLAIWPATAGDPRATQLEYAWSKICIGITGGDFRCSVSANAKAACYPAGGMIVVGDELTVILSTRHALKTGAIDIQIDDAVPISISASCVAFECKGQLAIDSEFIERLKRSRTLTVQAVNSANQAISLSIPLSDFEGTYEGPATPPKVIQLLAATGKDDLARQAAIRKLPVCDE